ncbi:MAG: VWA domain-containing protein [Akkermansia sp.]|nr:VWA domain-containing protein [Akkermansia sp.]
MSFLYPNILWFLLLIPVLVVLVVVAWRSTGQGWRSLISAQHRELVKQRPLWRTALPATLALLALICTIIALARPINGYREGGATTTGRNLLIALDISRSMETEDVKPSRLAEARAAAYELIDALPGDKIGLIVFSGEADLVVPLTYDHTALRDALEQVNRTWAGVGGTNFGLVLRKAMQDFKRSTPEGSTNALVILSDGEDTVNSSLEIAEEAKESNLLVITVGIGTAAGGPIPDARGENGLYQDTNGKHVISKLNTESLSQFAKATGGDFFVMDSNANLAAFTQAAVSKIDKHEEAFSLNKIPNDLFTPFASTALLLLIFAALSSTEWRQYKHFIILLLLSGMTPDIQAAPAEESATAFKLGLEHMRSGEKEKAKEAFSTALLDEDTALQAASLYQLGQINATATFDELRALYGESPTEGIDEGTEAPQQVTPEALQKIVDSLKQDVQPYHDALKLQPGLARARKNIAGIEQLIKKLEEEIERLKQQQQEQQEQQQQQNNEQNQNQQQDDQQKSDKDQEDKEDNQNQKDDSEQKEESQDKKDQQNPQDKKDDSQNKQDSEQDQQQDQQQEQENQSQDNQQDQQQEQPEQKDAPQQDDKQEQQDPQAPQPQKEQPSDEEKARRYAASVLRSHMDEEQGSPIPHADVQVRPPDKDY